MFAVRKKLKKQSAFYFFYVKFSGSYNLCYKTEQNSRKIYIWGGNVAVIDVACI